MDRLWWLGFFGLAGLLGYPWSPGLYGLFGLFALFALNPRLRSRRPAVAATGEHATDEQLPNRRALQFSLRTLLVLMCMVAAFFAGRASDQVRLRLTPSMAGVWQTKSPSGAQNPLTLTVLDDGRIQFYAQNCAFNGVYTWRKRDLAIVEPSDKRMKGLVWRWNGAMLQLVAEPTNFPTGASYMGTTLTKN